MKKADQKKLDSMWKAMLSNDAKACSHYTKMLGFTISMCFRQLSAQAPLPGKRKASTEAIKNPESPLAALTELRWALIAR